MLQSGCFDGRRSLVAFRKMTKADKKCLLKVVRWQKALLRSLRKKAFGFIDTGSNKDLFFHMSSLDGCRFEELQEGQKVEFTQGDGPKGPVAENVKII